MLLATCQPADTFVDARTRTAHTAVSCASSWQPPGPAHTGPTAQESPQSTEPQKRANTMPGTLSVSGQKM